MQNRFQEIREMGSSDFIHRVVCSRKLNRTGKQMTNRDPVLANSTAVISVRVQKSPRRINFACAKKPLSIAKISLDNYKTFPENL